VGEDERLKTYLFSVVSSLEDSFAFCPCYSNNKDVIEIRGCSLG